MEKQSETGVRIVTVCVQKEHYQEELDEEVSRFSDALSFVVGIGIIVMISIL